jgi:hypothetical protein
MSQDPGSETDAMLESTGSVGCVGGNNKVTVIVTAGPVLQDGEPKWSLAGSFSDKKAGKVHADGVIEFNSGPWKNHIVFNLKDESGLGLVWMEPACQAIWSKVVETAEDDTCPSEGNVNHFKHIEFAAGNLALHNKNHDAALIRFALRFADSSGKPVDYDPVIRNGGGGN